MRVLFHAINKVGLGHVIRLSGLQRTIQSQGLAECRYFTSSAHVQGLFTCPGSLVEEDPDASVEPMTVAILEGLWRAVVRYDPDVVVCDTYWPRRIVAQIRARGIRTVLVQRMMRAAVMREAMREASAAFDAVLVPHHPHEVSWTYRDHPGLIRYLESLPVGFIGPLARTAPVPANSPQVIFTLGGGGEWPRASDANRINTYLRAFLEAGRLMERHGLPKPLFAAGPLMRSDVTAFGKLFTLIDTNALFEYFGPGGVVVSRGGYNTSWEAIAATSRLVLCGTHSVGEDIKGRCAFFSHEGLGRAVPAIGGRLFEAIVAPATRRERDAPRRWSRVVNAGVPVAVDEVMGGSFLRASEPPGAASRATHRRTGVSPVLWPGPRVRNELRLYRELSGAGRPREQGATGMDLRGNGLPGFVPEYLSRLFGVITAREGRPA
jgi:hypothetical protein